MSLPMSPTPKCLQKSRYFFLYFFLYLYPLHRVLCPLLFPPLFSTLPNLSLNLPSYLSPLVCFALCPFLSSWFCSHTHSLTPVSLPCSCIYFPLIFWLCLPYCMCTCELTFTWETKGDRRECMRLGRNPEAGSVVCYSGYQWEASDSVVCNGANDLISISGWDPLV